ncbi:MAG: TraB/GumN family protein [Candidatus Altiarchaeota archaeon]
MLNQVTEVGIGEKTFYLIGTAHVSEESVNLVEETIKKIKPEAVAVELCPQRMAALDKKRKWDESEITDILKRGQTHLFLTQLMLSNIQRRIGEDFGVKPGSEMMAAVNAARKEGIDVALVDRDVKVTLKRALAKMSLTEKLKIGWGFLIGMAEGEEIDKELLEQLKKKDILNEMMDEISKEIPSVKEVLVDERNQFIAGKLRTLPQKKIVAVLGAGHIEGVVEELKREHTIEETERLTEIPVTKNKLKIIAYLIPAIFTAIIIYGFTLHGSDVTYEMLKNWILINGTLSALGAALAFGHPLTILAAFFAAPITSLNPTIAAGWVAGLVELKYRKPRVMDFQNLLKMNSLKDYWGNRVTRTILVIAFANIGSSAGTFIALPYLASLI